MAPPYAKRAERFEQSQARMLEQTKRMAEQHTQMLEQNTEMTQEGARLTKQLHAAMYTDGGPPGALELRESPGSGRAPTV